MEKAVGHVHIAKIDHVMFKVRLVEYNKSRPVGALDNLASVCIITINQLSKEQTQAIAFMHFNTIK